MKKTIYTKSVGGPKPKMEIAELFVQDIREKKREASNIRSRVGRKGYLGKMLFPSDIMSRKDKYNHRKAGKVEMRNMYENLVPYQEFLSLSDEDKKRHLTAYRNSFTNDEIVSTWKISTNTLYKYVKDLELPKAKRTDRDNKRTAKVKKVASIVPVPSPVPVEAYLVEENKNVPVKQDEEVQGLEIKIKGILTSEKLIKRLEKLSLILLDEESEFELDLRIKEIIK